MFMAKAMNRYCCIIAVLACYSPFLFAQSPLLAHSSEKSQHSTAKSIRTAEGAQAMVNMPSVAPLFIENKEFKSTFYVVNEGSVPITGRLLLLAPQGNLISDTYVTVPGHDQRDISIKSLLDAAHATVSNGSLELFDDNEKGSALVGQLVISYQNQSNIDEELLMPAMSSSHRLRGLAVQAVASPLVAVSSTSEQPTQFTIACTEESGKQIVSSFDIKSHQTVMIRPCSQRSVLEEDPFMVKGNPPGKPHAVGLELFSEDPHAELQAFGLSPTTIDGKLSFTPISFNDPEEHVSNQTIYPGLQTGPVFAPGELYTPHVAVQNYSTQPKQVSVFRAVTSHGSSTYLKSMSFTVEALSVRSMIIQSSDMASGDDATLVVESDGNDEDVQSQMWSEEPLTHAQIVFAGKSAKDDRNAGMHPWSLENGAQDELYLYNQGEEPQTVFLKISNRVSLWNKKLTLAPHETRRMSLRQLAEGKEADDSKNSFAPGLGKGEISWYTAGFGKVRGRLQHRAGQDRFVSSFQCAGYVVFCGIDPISGPSTVLVGQSATYSSYSYSCVNNLAPQLCYGVQNGYFSADWTWTGTGSALSGSSGSASITVKGAAPGSAQLDVTATDPYLSCSFSESQNVTVNPAVDSTPVISSISPSSWNSGSTVQVNFSGQHFGTNAPTLSFSPPSGISYSFYTYSDTSIVAYVTVAAGTPTENVSVTVTNNGYGGLGFNNGGTGQSATSKSASASVVGLPTLGAIKGPKVLPISYSGSGVQTNTIQLNSTGSPDGGTYLWTSSNTSFTLSGQDSAVLVLSSTASGTSTMTEKYTLNGKSVSQTATITVQIPTTATLNSPLPAQTNYSNQTETSCDLTTSTPKAFGYQQCVLYQIGDQATPSASILGYYLADEQITEVYSNVGVSLNNGGHLTNNGGEFGDQLSLLGTNKLPTNACEVLKQTFSVNGTIIRTNCLQFTATTVAITDITKTPNSCIQTSCK